MPRAARKSIESEAGDAGLFRARLLSWYRAHGRAHLPWRTTRDPYHIYVSEVMLQQTQVETVLSRYYFPFLERFPTLQALAGAPREDVLKAWQGLGYYTRAANLHKAAQAIVTPPDGGVRTPRQAWGDKVTLPGTVEALMQLPGIGRNTAHAVAAFGFRLPVAVMEANVKRVVSRIFALAQPDEKTLWQRAGELLDHVEPFDYNQAMMDLGAMVCTRTKPKCGECPANHFCLGQSDPAAYPAPKAAKQERVRKKIIIVRQDAQGRFHATPRTTRFLGGMYEFEEHPLPSRGRDGVGATTGDLRVSPPPDLPPAGGGFLGHIRQVYSHFTLEAEVYLLRGKGGEKDWHTLAELERLPHSKAEEKIITLLQALL